MGIGIILGIIALLLYYWNKKVIFYKDRNGKKMIIGEFVRYEFVNEKVLRNKSHTSAFPFVKINQGTEDAGIYKLNYQNELVKSFKKGEKVELFWCNNKLLYWKAYEIGILKFLPKKWLF